MKTKQVNIFVKCKCCGNVITRVLGFSTDRPVKELLDNYAPQGNHIVSIEIEEEKEER